MLNHLGFKQAHDHILSAIEKVISMPKNRTLDLGGNASTSECGDAIANAI